MSTRKPEITDLHKAIEKVAPIIGVSRKEDSVRIDYASTATTKQKRAAESVLASWDWNANVEKTPSLEERITKLEGEVMELRKIATLEGG